MLEAGTHRTMALMGGEETVRADVKSREHIKDKKNPEVAAEKEKEAMSTKKSRREMAMYKRSEASGRGLIHSRKPWCTSELQEEMTQEM